MEKNTHSFYYQDLAVGNSLQMPNEDVLQISQYLHQPLVGFALLQQKLLLVHINIQVGPA